MRKRIINRSILWCCIVASAYYAWAFWGSTATESHGITADGVSTYSVVVYQSKGTPAARGLAALACISGVGAISLWEWHQSRQSGSAEKNNSN